ncbi:hypothetical protein [Nesterenkonia jeotgali]|uniref:Terminase small subunit actinomycetes phage-type domain-containing protein n=1 Tax=Nesterenkonia jeotgali TaxID=317018 RepID=A0A0W8ICX4_9MICC|nr:hypothetical protein [Nesterenkonia jeotgali]KUG57785.1 hypothetical protein AVL63_04480 [Nesterenkonia jeotgali]
MSNELAPELRQLHRGYAGPQKVLQATNAAVREALANGHLTKHDAGAIELARALSRKVDRATRAEEIYLEMLIEGKDLSAAALPASDNTVIPTLLKVYEHLGLTPRARAYIDSINARPVRAVPGSGKKGSGGSKIAGFNRGASG